MTTKNLLFALTFLLFKFGYSSDVIGSDIRYTYMGNDTFYVYVSHYYDCNKNQSGNLPASIYSINCASNLSYSRSPTTFLKTINDVTNKCNNNIISRCQSSTSTYQFGIQNITEVYKVYLGGVYTNCCEYEFSLILDNRATSNTISVSNTPLVRISIIINRCVAITNNLPQYKNLPEFILNQGINLTVNNGAYDIDGDSLVTSLITVNNSPATPPSYISPYTPTNPFASSTGFTLNKISGDFTFTPTSVQTAFVAYKTEEFRTIGGVVTKISEIAREHIVYIIAKSNEAPKPTINSQYTFCTGTQQCITIPTTDLNVSDSTFISWNSAIPGATFNATNSSIKQTGTFCWTPPANASRTYPYYFTITVRDNHCPAPTINRKSIAIYVIDTPPTATRIYTPLGCSIVKGSAIIDSNLNIYQPSVSWIIQGVTYSGNSFTHTFDSAGKYIITAITQFNSTCKTIYYDTITVNSVKLKAIPIPDSTVCYNTSISISPIITQKNGSTIVKYNGVTVTNNILNYTAKKDSTFRVEIIDSNNCSILDSFTIFAISPLSLNGGKDTTFCLNGVLYPLSGIPAGGIYSGNGVVPFGGGYSFNPALAGTGIIPILYSKNNGKCLNTDTVLITVKALPIINAGNDTTICVNNGIQILPLNAFPTGGVWSLLLGKFGAFNGTSFNISLQGPGFVKLIYTYTGNNGCTLNDTFQINILPAINVDAGNDTSICRGINSYNLSNKGNPIGGIWSTPGSTILNNILPLNSLSVGVHSIFYTFNNGNCIETDSFLLTVVAQPNVKAGNDITVCKSSNSVILQGTPSGGLWNGQGITGNTVSMSNLNFGQHIYTYSFSQNGCIGTDTMKLNIVRDPESKFTALPITGSAPLLVNFTNQSLNATSYTWDFGDPSSGVNNISTQINPTHSYNTNGNYTIKLSAKSNDGCTRDSTFTNYINVYRVGLNIFSSQQNSILVYPIPTKDILTITRYENLLNDKPISFSILNTLGQEMMNGILLENKTSINVKDLESGIYFIKVGVEIKKVVIE